MIELQYEPKFNGLLANFVGEQGSVLESCGFLRAGEQLQLLQSPGSDEVREVCTACR